LSKAINRRTANDHANASGRVFSCPATGCRETITEAWTVERFDKHMDEDLHTTHFFQLGSHRCPFGCQKGFLNDCALHKHIQKGLCEDGETLFEDIKRRKQCNHSSGRTPDTIGALDHLADRHTQLTSVAGLTLYVCAPSGIGFPTEALFWSHLALVGLSDTAYYEDEKKKNDTDSFKNHLHSIPFY
jgi:hypothetical protein